MEIKVLKIAENEQEKLEIHCHEVTEEVKDIVTFVKSRQGQLTGMIEGKQYEIPVAEVYYVEAVDNDGVITFLHKVKNGAVDKSYGIHVASLAKMPDEVIVRANEILNIYENEKGKKEPRMQRQHNRFY